MPQFLRDPAPTAWETKFSRDALKLHIMVSMKTFWISIPRPMAAIIEPSPKCPAKNKFVICWIFTTSMHRILGIETERMVSYFFWADSDLNSYSSYLKDAWFETWDRVVAFVLFDLKKLDWFFPFSYRSENTVWLYDSSLSEKMYPVSLSWLRGEPILNYLSLRILFY